MSENLHLVDHPVIHHKLTLARDRTTDRPQFRSLLHEITELLTYHALSDAESEIVEVPSPIDWAGGRALVEPFTLVPILRSGLGMLDGAMHVIPSARIGHLGVYRDPTTFEPVIYYNKLPLDVDTSTVLMLDAMLATGASCSAGIDILKRCGVKKARVICLITTPLAIDRLASEHPDIPIYAAAVDPIVTTDGRISPGLGDVGFRLFGTA